MFKDKLSLFQLPKKVNGNYIVFDYDNYGSKRNLFNVEEKNGNWYLCSNYDNKFIQNDIFYDNIEIKVNSFYNLQLNNNDNIVIYTDEAFDKSITQRKFSKEKTIIVGSNLNSSISYNIGIAEQQFKISYENGKYHFINLNPQITIYVNHIPQIECFFDHFCEIFCMGLKIIIIEGTIFINKVNLVSINEAEFESLNYQLATPDMKKNIEIYRNFYDERDYFIKAPILQKKIHPFTLTITKPPSKQERNVDSILMTIIPSGLMSLTSVCTIFFSIQNFNKGGGSMESLISACVMGGTMLISSMVWPMVEKSYQKKNSKKREQKRIEVYQNYLDNKEKILKDAITEQKIIIQENNLSLQECQDTILKKNTNLFSRSIEREDFLTIRLGIGDVPLQYTLDYTKDDFLEENDTLLTKIDEIIEQNKIINNVPVTLSLFQNPIVAFISDRITDKSYLNAIVLQLLTFYSYIDLKLVILTDEIGEHQLSYLKKVNHCFSNDKSIRFFATNFEEAQTISSYLEKELNYRKSKNNKNDNKDNKDNLIPYYLIIQDASANYHNLMIIDDILEEKNNYGFGIIFFDKKISNIPNGCNYFVNYDEKQGTFFNSIMSEDGISNFIPEFIDNTISMENCATALSNIPLHVSIDSSANIPTNIGFLEMYQVGRIEQLNIINRWNNSDLINSLAVPIGIDGFNNIVNLDLHEKKHGPHGLIAGMTGSGKSEFIITFILSLAVNFRPDELQFVLIDYKGGGLAGAFENRKAKIKLPHLIGTITNLDKSSIKRSLASIQSEIQKRQHLFNDAKEQLGIATIDIYKYQKLYRDNVLKTPMSHLFIICDEFAELKEQQPDFMEQIISAARIGRSLGIHLILATQKPSGVVDEQIWSNSKFKVCCKVQTEEDSREMIRRTEAAYIKEIGRFFLQVGYDEYFIESQSAYTGAPYVPTDKIRSKIDNSMIFIKRNGEIEKTGEILEETTTENENQGAELDNILKYIIKIADQEGYVPKQLWLDNISSCIYIEDIKQKYQNELIHEPCILNPVIGEYDNPSEQSQGVVTLPITRGGNSFIVGVTSSGKTTLLSTIIYSIIMHHRTEEAQIYIMDFGNENLRRFADAPQVGEVLTITDSEKIETLLHVLERETKRRKQLFVKTGTNFIEYSQKYGLANIVVFINGLDIFKENFEDLYENTFISFTRDCNKFGITFIATSGNLSTLDFRISNNFPQIISLRLLDNSDYYDIYGKNDLALTNCPGRGFVKLDDVYEFQTALLFDSDHLETNLNYIFNQLNTIMRKTPKVPTMPNVINEKIFSNTNITLQNIPVGISLETKLPAYINLLKKISLISSSKLEIISYFLDAFIKIISNLNKTKIIILNGREKMNIPSLENIKYYDNNFKSLLQYLYKNFQTLNNSQKDESYLLLIVGYKQIQKHLEALQQETPNEKIINLNDIILLGNEISKVNFLFCDTEDSLRILIKNKSLQEIIDKTSGIWLGDGISEQKIIHCKNSENLYLEEDNQNGYIIENSDMEKFNYIQGGDIFE